MTANKKKFDLLLIQFIFYDSRNRAVAVRHRILPAVATNYVTETETAYNFYAGDNE